MHGENILRKNGKKVRGRFGTGKSAAFGIAKKLTIDTVKKSKKNIVELRLHDIKGAEGGKPFPVTVLTDNENTDECDGTRIIISELKNQQKIDIGNIRSFVEKKLSRYRLRHAVYINDCECKIKKTPSIKTYELHPPEEIKKYIGDVLLTIEVSPIPLKEDERGIDITSHENLHETFTEVQGEQVNRIFGFVDVPYLEDKDDETPAFNNTRDSQLNRSNERVHKLLYWLETEIRKVQNDLVIVEKEKKKDEQLKKLKSQAKELAKLLNSDFADVMDELEMSRQIIGRKKTKHNSGVSDEGDVLPGEGDNDSHYEEYGNEHGEGAQSKDDVSSGNEKRPGPDLKIGESKGEPSNWGGKERRRNRGVFAVDFEHATKEYQRSRYEETERTIYINLDHPQINLVYLENENSVNTKNFKMNTYEAAIVEYAQAIQYERIQSGEELEPLDLLFNIKETIDKLMRKFVEILS